MRKLDLIIENVRDEYMINLLEEGETTELETLKTKKFLNENLNRIRKMLIEEGALEGVKQHLGNNWGKYLAGAGAGAAGLAANHYLGGDDSVDARGEAQAFDAMPSEGPVANPTAEYQVPNQIQNLGVPGMADAVINQNAAGFGGVPDQTLLSKAGQMAGDAGDAIGNAAGRVGDAYETAKNTLGVGAQQAREEHMANLTAGEELSPTQTQPAVIPTAWSKHG